MCALHNQRMLLVRQAEAYDLKTKAKGARMGALGDSGVKILRVILFRFLNLRRGAAWPSYNSLQEATGYCRQTIADGLKRLKEAGFLLVTKRAGYRDGRIERETNLYQMPPEPPPLPPADSLPSRDKPQTQEFIPLEQLSLGLQRALASLGNAVGLPRKMLTGGAEAPI